MTNKLLEIYTWTLHIQTYSTPYACTFVSVYVQASLYLLNFYVCNVVCASQMLYHVSAQPRPCWIAISQVPSGLNLFVRPFLIAALISIFFLDDYISCFIIYLLDLFSRVWNSRQNTFFFISFILFHLFMGIYFQFLLLR